MRCLGEEEHGPLWGVRLRVVRIRPHEESRRGNEAREAAGGRGRGPQKAPPPADAARAAPPPRPIGDRGRQAGAVWLL